jgi:hypothetical protein
MINIAYFRNVLTDPARRASLIARTVNQLCETNDWERDADEFNRWMKFYERLLTAANNATSQADLDLATACINVTASIASDTANRDVYSPNILHTIDHRRNTGRDIGTMYIENILTDDYPSATASDREYIERIVNRHARTFTCDDCEELHTYPTRTTVRGGTEICASCLDDNYVFSDYYEEYIHRNNARDAIDAHGNDATVEDNDDDFEWNDDLETYTHVDYTSRRVIRAYHSSKEFFAPIHDDWTRQHNRHMGIELEVEAPECDPRPIARKINDTANGGRVGERLFFERDGSLTNGFEIITQPMSLPMIRETFDFLKHPQNTAGLRSHRTTTCGLHVHVSRAGLTNITIGRAVTFVNDPRNDSFVMALARRYNTGYCKIVEKDPETAHLPADRYEAINLTPRNTIEFRLFRGSLKYDAVIAAAEFAHALLAFCARPETTSIEMNPRTFLLWCAANIPEDTKIMRDYVNQRTAGTFAIDVAA